MKGQPMLASTLSLSLSADSPSNTTPNTFVPFARYLSQWSLSAAATWTKSLEGIWSIIVR